MELLLFAMIFCLFMFEFIFPRVGGIYADALEAAKNVAKKEKRSKTVLAYANFEIIHFLFNQSFVEACIYVIPLVIFGYTSGILPNIWFLKIIFIDMVFLFVSLFGFNIMSFSSKLHRHFNSSILKVILVVVAFIIFYKNYVAACAIL